VRVRAYTDGSSGKDGHGGAAVVLIGRRSTLEIGEHLVPPCTNQDAELTAVLLAFDAIKREGAEVEIISDSAYIINCFRDGWVPGWRKRGWQTSSNKPVVHRAMWETIEALAELHDVIWTKVKGHAGDHYNERADEIAHNARVRRASGRRRLYHGTGVVVADSDLADPLAERRGG
jgi:ribonuclease HI